MKAPHAFQRLSLIPICGPDGDSDTSGVHGLLYCERDGKFVLAAPGHLIQTIKFSAPGHSCRAGQNFIFS